MPTCMKAGFWLQLRVAVGGPEDLDELGEDHRPVDVLERRREVRRCSAGPTVRASTSCWVQPGGIGSVGPADAAADGAADGCGGGRMPGVARLAAALGRRRWPAAVDAPAVGAWLAPGPYVQVGAPAGVHEAIVAATSPPPATAAPRRNPRRDRALGTARSAVVRGSGRSGRGSSGYVAETVRIHGRAVSRCGSMRAEVTSGPSWRAGRQKASGRAARLLDRARARCRPSSRTRSGRPACRLDAVLDLVEALDAATRGIAGVLSFDRVLQLIVRPGPRPRPGRVRRARDRRRRRRPRAVRDQRHRPRRARADRAAAARPRAPRAASSARPVPVRIPDIAAIPGATGSRPTIRRCARSSACRSPSAGPGRRRPLPDEQARGAASSAEADQALVEMFALHAGIAIENARLHEQVQRLAVVEERERIGQDLHDGIIQGIYARRPLARGRARAHGRRPGRGAGPDRSGDRRAST